MTFLNPSAGYWAFLAIPIVLFYLLKVTVRLVPVSTVMFWDQVLEERTSESLWQKFRHLSSLLMQLLLLALLIFAVADPLWSNTADQNRRIVVIMDQSGSMNAQGDGDRRFQIAKAQAFKLIDGLRPEDEMAIVAAGGQETVVSGFTSHQKSLRNALQKILPADGSADLPKAIALAKRLTSDTTAAQVVVFTDGCAEVDSELLNDESIVWKTVGESQDNAALTGLQIRRSLVDPTGYQILLRLNNFSDQAREATIDLKFNDQLLDVVSMSVPENGVETRIFEKTSVSGGVFSAHLDLDDGDLSDNVIYGILAESNRVPVTLVDSDNWFLQQVLRANQTVELKESSSYSQDENGVVVFEGATPSIVPSGSVLVVNPKQSTNLWEVDGQLQSPLVGKQDSESDVLRHVNLQNVLIPGAVDLKPLADHEVLIESVSGSPLMIRFPRPEGDVLVLAIDLQQGDLALRTAFPILLTNALLSFDRDGGSFAACFDAGSFADILLPASMLQTAKTHNGTLMVSSPTGVRRVVQVADDRLRFGAVDTAGVWLVTRPLTETELSLAEKGQSPTIDGPFLRFVCVRPTLESDLRSTGLNGASDRILQSGVGNRPIWFWVTITAAALLMVEWWLYHRRKIS